MRLGKWFFGDTLDSSSIKWESEHGLCGLVEVQNAECLALSTCSVAGSDRHTHPWYSGCQVREHRMTLAVNWGCPKIMIEWFYSLCSFAVDQNPNSPLTDEWIKKMWYIYTKEYYSAIKGQNNAICSNMDATRESHTEWRKPEWERQIPYDITYIWNLKYGTNEPIYKTETDIENRPVVAKGEGEGVGWTGSLALVGANYYILNG